MTRATRGGHFGGGFDIYVARSFSLGLNVGYNAMGEPLGAGLPARHFNGVQVGLASDGYSDKG